MTCAADVDTTGLFASIMGYKATLTAALATTDTTIPLSVADAATLAALPICFPVEMVICYRTALSEVVTVWPAVAGVPTIVRASTPKKFPLGATLTFAWTDLNCTTAKNAAAGYSFGTITLPLTTADLLMQVSDAGLCTTINAGKQLTVELGVSPTGGEQVVAWACSGVDVAILRAVNSTTAGTWPTGTCYRTLSIATQLANQTVPKVVECPSVLITTIDCIDAKGLDKKTLTIDDTSLKTVLQQLICDISDLKTGAGSGGGINTAPVAPASQAFTCEPGTAVNFTLPAATDADGDALTISGTTPTGITASIDAANVVTLSGTCPAVGVYNFILTYADPLGATANVAVLLTSAAAVNNAPVAGTFPDQTASIGTAVTYNLSSCFTDPDGDVLTYALLVPTTLPAGLTFSTATGIISGTPTVASLTQFTVQATDPGGLSATCSFQLTINTVNQAPVVNAVSSQFMTIGDFFFFSAANCFVDPDGDALSYSVVGTLPPDLVLNAANGGISGLVDISAFGTPTGNMVIRATDPGGLFADCTIPYTILFNLGIRFDAASGGFNVITGQNQVSTESVAACFTPPSGITVTYATADPLPAGLTLDPATGALTGTPTAAGVTSVNVKGTGSDGSTATCAVVITIDAPPVSGAFPNQAHDIGDAVVLDMTTCFSDPESDVLVYSSVGILPPGLSLDAGTGALSGIPTTAGTFAVIIRATDPYGGFADCSYTHTIAVSISANAPVSGGFLDQNLNQFDPVLFDMAATFTDPDGDVLTYSAITTLPSALTLNPSTGLLSGTAVTIGSFAITVRATDPGGLTADTTFTLTVA